MGILVVVPTPMARSRDTNLPNFAAKTQAFYAELEGNHAVEGRKMVVIVRRVLRRLWWDLGSMRMTPQVCRKSRMFESEW